MWYQHALPALTFPALRVPIFQPTQHTPASAQLWITVPGTVILASSWTTASAACALLVRGVKEMSKPRARVDTPVPQDRPPQPFVPQDRSVWMGCQQCVHRAATAPLDPPSRRNAFLDTFAPIPPLRRSAPQDTCAQAAARPRSSAPQARTVSLACRSESSATLGCTAARACQRGLGVQSAMHVLQVLQPLSLAHHLPTPTSPASASARRIRVCGCAILATSSTAGSARRAPAIRGASPER
jgi:hypothetical protein